MTKQTKRWMHSLIAAAISGGANGITVMIVDPVQFNFFQGGTSKLLTVILVGAIVGTGMFLKQSPLPTEEPSPIPM